MKILIPLDGSIFAEEILAATNTLVSHADSEIHLLKVLDPKAAHITWMEAPPPTMEIAGSPSIGRRSYSRMDPGHRVVVETLNQATDRLRNEALDYLHHISVDYFDSKAHTKVLIEDHVVEAISKYVASEKIDLIAIATHGRTGLSSVLMGSVASGLLQARVAPLFMVRPSTLN